MKKPILVVMLLVIISAVSGIYIYINWQQEENQIIVSVNEREIMIKHQLTEEQNIIIVYDKIQNNKFQDIQKFIVQDSEAPASDFSGEVVMSTATDFVSPYGLLAVNNTLNNNTFSVGGAHGTEGSDGFPTGRFDELTYITLDGKPLSDGIHVGEFLEFKVKHLIYASNIIEKEQNRNSMLEERTYLISSGDHKIDVKMTALEDIILTRYAGLQMIQSDYYDYFYIPNNKEIFKIKGEPEGLHFVDGDFDNINRAVLFNEDSILVMETDREYGIGTGEYAPESTQSIQQSPIYFSGGEFGKIYSHNDYFALLSPLIRQKWSIDIQSESGNTQLESTLKIGHVSGLWFT